MAGGAGGGGGGGGGGGNTQVIAKKGGRPVGAPNVHWGNPDTVSALTLDLTSITLPAGAPTTIAWGKAGAGSSDTLGNSKNQAQTGTAADKWTGGTGTDFFDGGAGDDTLKGGLGDDILVGGTGVDRVEGVGGSEVLHGSSLNGIDTGTVVVGANAPGGGGWLNPKDPANQGSPAFSAYKVSVKATGTATTTVTNPDGTTTGPTPTPVSGSYDSTGSLWDLTPGTGTSAGHAALVTPHFDPNATSTTSNTVTNPDGSTSTTTTRTTGAFVIPPPNTPVSDADFLLDGKYGETEVFDLTRSNGQVVAGFDMLFVGMSGDGNPASGIAGAVHWVAKADDETMLGSGDMHNPAGSTTLRSGAAFSVDTAKHVSHLELTPAGSTVVLPQTLALHYLDPSAPDASREAAMTSQFGSLVTSHASNDQLVPFTLTKDAGGKVTRAAVNFSPDGPDIGVNYKGDILTGGDVNSLSGDGTADIFVLGTGMQGIRDFEIGLDKVQVGLAAGGGTDDLAYAVKDALEIASRDGHPDLLVLPQGSMLWNEHGVAWKPSDFVGAGIVTQALFTSDTPDAAGMFHFNPAVRLNDTLGLTAAGLAR